MLKDLKAGLMFHWQTLDGSEAGTAVVMAVRTDREEGVSSEIEQYAALWLDARAEGGVQQGDTLTFMLGTDQRAYLSGREVELNPA